MRVTLIAALTPEGVVGRDGQVPWHLPADLARFKARTMGHHLVMGRKTWESIGRPLPGRRMVVITRRPVELTAMVPEEVAVVASPAEALALAEEAGESETFVAGGGEIYRALLPRADRLDLTRVEAPVAGDTFFPPVDFQDWELVDRQDHPADARNPHPYSFRVYRRSMEIDGMES